MRSMATKSSCHSGRGVTLVELVVVLAILAILSVTVAMALRDPIRSYVDTNRRGELADAADTALRRIARDVRLALPNSLRVAGGGPIYLELLLTKTGGRYRGQPDASGNGNALDFSTADSAFDTLGPTVTATGQTIAANDILVVHNLFASASVTSANAYTYNQAAHNCSAATSDSASCNTARITGTGAGTLSDETRINFDARRFPLQSPGNRFQVVSGPVTYVCSPGAVDANGNGTGSLTRVSGYTIQLTQPTGSYAGSPTSALLAQNVTACQITYNPLVLTQSLGLLSMRISLTRGGETVNLYHEVHVSNIP